MSDTKPRLLIVDDEDGPRQSLKIVFAQEYDVQVARSGAEAVKLASAKPFHVVILDIRMPGMDGIQTLEALKEMDPLVEVLMLTAYETLETARQALRLGACDYLNKPFDLDAVRAGVSRALERRMLAGKAQNSLSEIAALEKLMAEQKIGEEMAKEKGEIYASVLHDINGPLTIISAFAQMMHGLLARAGTSVEGEQLDAVKRNVAHVTQQADRCIELSRRYLGFLRGTAGKESRVPLRQALEDLRELLKRHPAAKGNELNIHEFAETAAPDMNGTDLIQILLNLTINALQATTDPHRVDVNAQFSAALVDLADVTDSPGRRVINREKYNPAGAVCAVTVSDNGPGIPADALDKMFESYFTTKAERGGTGLGLSIVRRLLRESGAALVIQTKEGTGTKFTLYIPAVT